MQGQGDGRCLRMIASLAKSKQRNVTSLDYFYEAMATHCCCCVKSTALHVMTCAAVLWSMCGAALCCAVPVMLTYELLSCVM